MPFYINCESKTPLSKRDWQGRIVSKGLPGYLDILYTGIKHVYKDAPLMQLLTVVAELRIYARGTCT